MGDGEGEGKVGKRKHMIAWVNSREFLRGDDGFPQGGGGWNSASRKMEDGEFWQGNRLGDQEAMVRKGTTERLGEFG